MRALFTRTIKKKKKKEKHAFTRFKDRPLSVVRLLRYSYVSSQYARPYPKYKRGARNLSLSPFPPSPIGVATVILPPSWFKINKRSRANGPKIPASGTAAGDVYPGRKWILEPDFRDRVRTTISPRKEPPSRGRERGKGREGERGRCYRQPVLDHLLPRYNPDRTFALKTRYLGVIRPSIESNIHNRVQIMQAICRFWWKMEFPDYSFFSLSLFLVYSVDVFDVIVINFWYESNFYFEYLVRRK